MHMNFLLVFAAQSPSVTSSVNTVEILQSRDSDLSQTSLSNANHVQAATQTPLPIAISTTISSSENKSTCTAASNTRVKKAGDLIVQQPGTPQLPLASSSRQILPSFSAQHYQLDPASSKMALISNRISNSILLYRVFR